MIIHREKGEFSNCLSSNGHFLFLLPHPPPSRSGLPHPLVKPTDLLSFFLHGLPSNNIYSPVQSLTSNGGPTVF